MKIVGIGSLLIMLLLFSILCMFIPKIEMNINGTKYINVLVGENYNELGVKSYLIKNLKKKKIEYEIIGNVDTNKLGTYVITYKSKFKNIIKENIRIVNVIDNEKPKITINENTKLCKKNQLLDLNFTAYDNYDGDISKNIKYKIKNDILFLSVEDSSGNKTEVKQNLKYIDSEKPIISLIGNKIIYISQYDNYEDLGATAYDSCDGNITENISIKNEVDTTKIGTYKVSYSVKDSFGNVTTEYRNVIVQNDETAEYPVINGATIYLTFDDGPSKYTKDILAVLDKYNIKATFFVTNQFPEYQNMIKQEYESGHTIGIHTYSHKWSIYESIDSYLDDFTKIKNIIFEQTGIETKLFRFPGGSSNTISKKYNKGIMSELSKKMENDGYIYFDWTFDSGDTSKKNSSTNAIIKNVKTNLKGDGEYIILLHDIKKNTLEALPSIIEYALARGYKFSSLNENSPTAHFKIAN